MSGISAVVLTYNSERTIAGCLESIRGISDEIVIIDSFSTDKTPDICKGEKIRFFREDFKDFREQRIKGISRAKNDMILMVDADEMIDAALSESIRKRDASFFAYKIRFKTYYCGKALRFSRITPETHIRLYDRRYGYWEPQNIHEKFVVSVPVATLKGHILHFSFPDVETHKRKANFYAEMSALELKRKGEKAGTVRTCVWPVIKFFRNYFLYLGFLDGWRGFCYCRISAEGTYRKYLYLKRLNS